MNVVTKKLKGLLDQFDHVEDPVEAAKTMVSTIQTLTGIRNIFGNRKRTVTVASILATLCLCGVFIYVGPFSQMVYLIQVFPDKLETFKALNCLSATSVPLSKYIFMWTSRYRLRKIFALSHYGLNLIPAGSTARSEMLSTLRKARYVSWLVIINQASTHIIYIVLPFLFTLLTNKRYLPTTPGETYGLTPKYETPFYETTFVLTFAGTAFSAINQTGYIVLFITLLSHELGHFYALQQSLHKINLILNKKLPKTDDNEDTDATVDELLMFCVKYHQFSMFYHNQVKDLYKVIFGAHFLMMIIVLVTTLQTMNSWEISNTILTGVTGIMPLLLYCFGGEMLISACDEVSTSIYNSSWELMKVKQARIMLLMLCLSQKPLQLTAANVFVMNRETFGNVAQVIYKIYAVFN